MRIPDFARLIDEHGVGKASRLFCSVSCACSRPPCSTLKPPQITDEATASNDDLRGLLSLKRFSICIPIIPALKREGFGILEF